MTPRKSTVLAAVLVALLLAGCSRPIKATKQVSVDRSSVFAGRLRIDELAIDTALYEADVMNAKENQSIVDAKDSAALMRSAKTSIIADHNYQGFNGLYDAYKGCTARIEQRDGTVVGLRCTEVHRHSRLTDGDLYDESGSDALACNYPVIIYTCNPSLFGNTDSVTATYWDYG